MLTTCHRVKIRIFAHGKESGDVNFVHEPRISTELEVQKHDVTGFTF